ncbi:hypothetical protein C8A01DRAFT_15608 [Parachaetomium inaequale]|uniref:DNA mismatch repair protein S5 domain-containing protein n=1 Tax=Parachaetomium inaequale TaxID=2588326 RepID=A0AAN6PGM5_9PEZI|nr:hypothetical protein C8A01DRAFT_15608 [Parachaetomium inaequale]
MPISPLSEDTVRRLGSTLVITSPVLLLKELLDNALDAKATSIDVLVSPNTVDKIEVRDNGHGISPDDFDRLGRPGHTSKLESFDELGTLGGKTLGFRGVALASANALANVTLTTRVSTEHVATVISLAKGGGVGAQRHAGAPIGTTVCVAGLFSHLPVRLQVATKEAPKSLARMKDLLQSYAFARPSVKLRFTVLKTPNLSWSYAPAANGGVKEAAMQLFGAELASQCAFEIFPIEGSQEDDGASNAQNDPNSPPEEETGTIFEALFPKPAADRQKIARGAFLSVDARPVSTARGTAKKLISIFKRRIGDHFARAHSDATPNLKDPFIRLNIRCPPSSYDANIEPTKEDVLFKEEHRIIDQFELFLSFVYSATEPGHPAQAPVTSAIADVEASTEVVPEVPGQCLSSLSTGPSWRVDMSSGLDGMSDDEADDEGNGHTEQEIQHQSENEVDEDRSGPSSKEGLNPWSIAKLTGINRNNEPLPERHVQELHKGTQLWPPEPGATNPPEGSSLPTTEERRPGEGLERRLGRHGGLENPASQGRRLQDVFGHRHQRATARSARPPNPHDRPRRNHALQSLPTSSPHEYDHDRGGPRERRRPQDAAGSGRLVQSQISFDGNNRRQRRRDHHDLSLGQQFSEPSRRDQRTKSSGLTRRADLEDADFIIMTSPPRGERDRRRAARQASPPRRPLPHHRARDAGENATGAYLPGRSDEGTAQPTVLMDDPRARLIKQQRLMKSNVQKKPKRLKTEQLPLETIPRDSETCALLLTVTADTGGLAQLLTGASRFDTWLVDGELRGAFKDGIGAHDTARLVEPLLARIGQGAGVSA